MSESTQQSTSSSTPVVTETPENQIIDQISAYAQQLAGQMYSWAQGVFAQTSQITNQAVGNFFSVSQQMMGLSTGLTNQYNNLFAPENAQLVADANSYASPARMAVDMGMAGATQAQAGTAALANSEEALRSYGIDPSSGRYAALDKAADVQNAANVAGAENLQRQQDITTGQNLRSQAVQVGAQLPAAIANVNNTAVQANTGAVNSELANANTGANLFNTVNPLLSTAMGVKLPLQGNKSTSQSTGQSSSSQPNKGSPSPAGGGNGQPGAGGAGAGGGSTFNPAHGGAPGITSSPFGNTGDYSFNSPIAGMTGDEFGGAGNAPFQDFGTTNSTDPNDAAGNTFDSGPTAGFGGTDFNPEGTSGGGGNDMSGLGSYGYDPSSNPAVDLPPGWNDPAPSDPGTDWGNGADAYSGGGDDSGGDFAAGGAIPDAHAGPVPPQMSPSGGQKVDDVPAQGPGGMPIRLNAREFVIPDDVARWKGEEFFQKLINQSRMARHGAPAKPTAPR